MPIRMVWSTTCYGSTLANEWQAVGAKTVAGARFVNFHANTFGNFVNDWNKGTVGFGSAVTNADTATSRAAIEAYILSDATLTRNQWGGCPLLQTVMGSNPCAKDYFVTEWLAVNEWQNGKSGKDNMNFSSTMIITGDRNLTKNSKLKW